VQGAVLEYRPLIRDMPADERPRERLRMRGAESLTNAELIAILLRTGVAGENVVSVAQRLIARFDGLRGLGRASYGELAGERAMGGAKACQLLAAIELGKRIVQAEPEHRRVIKVPEDVHAMLFGEMALLEQEHFRVILLTVRNEVICVRDIYKGNVSSAVVRLGEVFRDAVREGCPNIIAVHNHPSGDPSPSAEDAALTKLMVEAGKLLGIELVDHIVIARRGFVSLRDRKMGFQ
jgi:DNA repair protein RadC